MSHGRGALSNGAAAPVSWREPSDLLLRNAAICHERRLVKTGTGRNLLPGQLLRSNLSWHRDGLLCPSVAQEASIIVLSKQPVERFRFLISLKVLKFFILLILYEHLPPQRPDLPCCIVHINLPFLVIEVVTLRIIHLNLRQLSRFTSLRRMLRPFCRFNLSAFGRLQRVERRRPSSLDSLLLHIVGLLRLPVLVDCLEKTILEHIEWHDLLVQ